MRIDDGPFRLGGPGPAAVLCIHGLTGTPYEVRPPAEALAVAGFTCVGLVLPGHGTTPEELGSTPRDAWLSAVTDAWDELSKQHQRVYVMGLSLGGVLALALSQRRPVAGAVIFAAPLRLARAVRYGVPLLHRVVRQLPKTPSILDDEARDEHPGYRSMPLGAVNELLQLSREVEAELARTTAPLQLIYSRLDPTVDAGDAERILSGVTSERKEVHYLENSGHVLPVDRERDQVAARVVGFLNRLESELDG